MTAFGRNLDVSAKDSRELCHALQGMTIQNARKYLENVIALKQVVPYTRHVKEVPHHKGIATGRWPKKAAGRILKVIESAKANAEQIGKDEEGLVIQLINTSRGNLKSGYGGKRSMHRKGRHRARAASVRVVLADVPGYVHKGKVKTAKKAEKTKVEKPEEKQEAQEEQTITKEEARTEKWAQKVSKEQ